MRTTILWSLSLLFFSVSAAHAGVELKGACGNDQKPLALKWSWKEKDQTVKFDTKSNADAIDQFLGRGSDFALVETPLRPSQVQKAGSRQFLYLPVALSALSVVYNLPGIRGGELNLSHSVLSDIYLGVITHWNDPAIQKLNPHVKLPDLDIFVIHLSNENSLNDAFPAFLVQENPKWTLKRERDKNIHWPVGENVGDPSKAVDKVRQWAGSIAVLDLSFCLKKHLPMAKLKNEAGKYVEPSRVSVEAALPAEPADMDKPLDLAGTVSAKAYPLANLIWLLVDNKYGAVYHQPKRGEVLRSLFQKIYSPEGQEQALDFTQAALPQAWIEAALAQVGKIQY